MGAQGVGLGAVPIDDPRGRPKPAKLTTQAGKRRGNSTLRASFQRRPSNMPDRGLRKRQKSAIPTPRAQLEQLAHRAPENPETFAAGPVILAPDRHPWCSHRSAERISACQNIPRAKPLDRARLACSRREQRGNSERTANPLQSIENVSLFSCSRFSLAHIRACMRARIRISPKSQNSENRQDCSAIT